MKNRLLKMESWGVIFTFAAGTLLHFCYELSNHSVWSILIAAVNESVWEHIKIFILPYLFWAIIEICYLKVPMKKTLVAKVIGIYAFAAITILLYILEYCWALYINSRYNKRIFMGSLVALYFLQIDFIQLKIRTIFYNFRICVNPASNNVFNLLCKPSKDWPI